MNAKNKSFWIGGLIAFCLMILSTPVTAQEDDDLLDFLEELDEEEEVVIDPKQVRIGGTFGGTHLINGETIETVPKRTWSFIISHRFGTINSGWRDFFGMDQASIRFAMEYGILDQLTVGFGRSTFEKTYDFYVKYRLLEQREQGIPISIAYFGDISINSLKPLNEETDYFSSRVAFGNQLLIASKVNKWISLQIMPTVVHQNLVETSQDPNVLFIMGVGARIHAHKMLDFVVEYYPRIKDNPESVYTDAFAIGLDLVTGGHVFQFQFTNANAMYLQGFTRKTTGNFWNGDIHFGFNISRTFGMNGKIKKEKRANRINNL